MLKPCAGKLARTVPRGRETGNRLLLPDKAQETSWHAPKRAFDRGGALNIIRNAGISHHVGKYSDAIEVIDAKRILYVSGTPGVDGESGDLPNGFTEQAELAWANVIRILGVADMSVENIVKLTQHMIRREDLAAYREIRARYLGKCEPASMLTFLPELVWPNMLIELEVVAAD